MSYEQVDEAWPGKSVIRIDTHQDSQPFPMPPSQKSARHNLVNPSSKVLKEIKLSDIVCGILVMLVTITHSQSRDDWPQRIGKLHQPMGDMI